MYVFDKQFCKKKQFKNWLSILCGTQLRHIIMEADHQGLKTVEWGKPKRGAHPWEGPPPSDLSDPVLDNDGFCCQKAKIRSVGPRKVPSKSKQVQSCHALIEQKKKVVTKRDLPRAETFIEGLTERLFRNATFSLRKNFYIGLTRIALIWKKLKSRKRKRVEEKCRLLPKILQESSDPADILNLIHKMDTNQRVANPYDPSSVQMDSKSPHQDLYDNHSKEDTQAPPLKETDTLTGSKSAQARLKKELLIKENPHILPPVVYPFIELREAVKMIRRAQDLEQRKKKSSNFDVDFYDENCSQWIPREVARILTRKEALNLIEALKILRLRKLSLQKDLAEASWTCINVLEKKVIDVRPNNDILSNEDKELQDGVEEIKLPTPIPCVHESSIGPSEWRFLEGMKVRVREGTGDQEKAGLEGVLDQVTDNHCFLRLDHHLITTQVKIFDLEPLVPEDIGEPCKLLLPNETEAAGTILDFVENDTDYVLVQFNNEESCQKVKLENLCSI